MCLGDANLWVTSLERFFISCFHFQSSCLAFVIELVPKPFQYYLSELGFPLLFQLASVLYRCRVGTLFETPGESMLSKKRLAKKLLFYVIHSCISGGIWHTRAVEKDRPDNLQMSRFLSHSLCVDPI